MTTASPPAPRPERSEESGYILILSALIMIPLLAFAGLAVDVGAWYSEGARVQRAADAAALAGVVHMPDMTKARTAALEAAGRNGYVDDGTPGQGIDIVVTDPGDDRLRVVITDHDVELYFSKVFLSSMTVARGATSQYVMPVPLGSPEPRFGNDPTTGYSPNFWGAISARYTGYDQGDPFTTLCSGSSTSPTSCDPSTATNAEHQRQSTVQRPGYLYAIDVPRAAGNTYLDVQVYDAVFRNRYNALTGERYTHETGDQRIYGTPSGGNPGVITRFEFLDRDGTLNDLDNVAPPNTCLSGPADGNLLVQPITLSGQTSPYTNTWMPVCRLNIPAGGGRYLLRVTAEGDGNATNQYSLRACMPSCTAPSGAQPRVFGVGDMSIFVNQPGTTTFHLAEVLPVHAGKVLIVELFDPGDGEAGASGQYHVEVVAPGASVPSCRFGVRDQPMTTIPTCRIRTLDGTVKQYDGKWLRIEVPLPLDYACSADCWWKVRYDFDGAAPQDRTTWHARISGDPVHLINDGD